VKIAFPGRRSRNLEDRRGQRVSRGRLGGMGGMPIPLPIGAGGGITGILVIVAIVVLQMCVAGGGGGGFGVDSPFDSIPGGQTGAQPGALPQTSAEEEALVDFVSAVFDDVQLLWAEKFAAGEMRYEDAKIVLFRDAVESECGVAGSEVGPFYCPVDGNVYLDLSFFDELHSRFGAPGDFAQAYVIAHEVAHHVQNQTGVSAQVRTRSTEDPDIANELSVRQELQADCLAGVWGHSARERGILEMGDLEEGITAASAIGDDRLQRQAGRRVNPETWTHGSSEQRVEWFRRGFDSGDPSDCDTFRGDI
jgi:predicted metalloprotease